MSRFLKTTVVLLLVLAATSLVLGTLLFRKRELLKWRTLKLEQAVMKLGVTIEAEPPVVDVEPNYPARDVDKVTAELNDDPRVSNFWESYDHGLELAAPDTINLKTRAMQLQRFYRADPDTGRPVRDPATGKKLTDGPGTMQALLDELVGKSQDQFVRLNDTRYQLRHTREELVHAVTGLNSEKQELRAAMVTIDSRDRTIGTLEDAIVARDAKIEECDDQLAELRDETDELERMVSMRDEALYFLSNAVARCEAESGRPGGPPAPAYVRGTWHAWTRSGISSCSN